MPFRLLGSIAAVRGWRVLGTKAASRAGVDTVRTRRPRRVIAISTGTFVRAALVVGLVWLWLRLWQWAIIALVAVALAVAAEPAVQWLDRRGIRRWCAAPLLILGGAGALLAFLIVSAASLREDAQLVQTRVSEFYGHAMSTLPT